MESVLLGVQRPQNGFTPSEALALPAPRAPRDRPPAPARRGATAVRRALKHPRAMPLPPPHRRGRGGQRRAAVPSPPARRLADRRWQRALGAGGPHPGEPRRRRAHPPADRPQRALRPCRPRVALMAAVAAVERLEGPPRRRHPRRRRACRDRLALRARGRHDRHRGAPSGERLDRHRRPLLLPGRAGVDRRRLRGARGPRRASTTSSRPPIASAAGRRSGSSGRSASKRGRPPGASASWRL